MKNTKKQFAFTIVELLVAMGLLVIVMTVSGFIFHNAIKSQRIAKATLEITQKLRAITTQLNADFNGLNKDGEIFIVWGGRPLMDKTWTPIDADSDGLYDGYERFDKIMFFATGDFNSYHQRDGDIRGNIARISYMIVTDKNSTGLDIYPDKRILARSQHIYTPLTFNDPLGAASIFPDHSVFNRDSNNWYEYDSMTMQQWYDVDWLLKKDIFSYITDLRVGGSTVGSGSGGLMVSPDDSESIHMLLAEGVGTLSIQGWYDDPLNPRWIPEIDPDGDGDVTNDTDFFLNGSNLDYTSYTGVWYRDKYPDTIYGPFADPMGDLDGMVWFGWPTTKIPPYAAPLNQSTFNDIPGLGRAFKFTFTLYDSMGIFPDGKTFTHIVYLDD